MVLYMYMFGAHFQCTHFYSPLSSISPSSIRYFREEPFTALNVDVRNQQHLFESLDAFVKGDFLEEKCEKTVCCRIKQYDKTVCCMLINSLTL